MIFNKLQKRALRTICSQNKYSYTKPVHKELKILDVKNIYKYSVGQFMFRYHNNLLRDSFDSYMTNLGKRSIGYTLVKSYNIKR